MTRVRLLEVTARYKHTTIGPLTMEFGPGITCLVGANGAGKSTVFRMLAGVQAPSDGAVDPSPGRDVRGASEVGYLPQELGLPGRATCRQYLDYVAWVYGIPRSIRPVAVSDALEMSNLADHAEVPVRNLSGGMRRRLGFAHAIVHRPSLVLLDEPTVGLDPVQRVAMRDVILGAGRDRITIVSTHLVDDVRALADRVIVIDHGAVVYDGDVAGLERSGVHDLEAGITRLMSPGERTP